MKKALISFISIAAILIAITACQPKYIIIPIPETSGKPAITIEDVGKGFDKEKLSNDIQDEINGIKDVEGLKANLSKTAQLSSLTGNSISTRAITIPETVYIIVEFSGYQNSETTIIRNGSMLLTATGKASQTSENTLSLEKYTAQSIAPMTFETTINNETSTNKVSMNITNALITGDVLFNSSGEINEEDIKITIEAPAQHSGSTITIDDKEIPIDQLDSDITAGFNGLFADGYGTMNSPYQIGSTKQFLNIGNIDFQEYLLEGNNENLYFELTSDIDLRGYSGYVGTVFSGTLIGNNHTITGSNKIHHMFKYNYEDVRFEDINIVFDDESVTLLVQYPAFFSDEEISAESFRYDKDSMKLEFIDVDYSAPQNNKEYYYPVRDNNFAFYADGSITASETYYNGDFVYSWTDTMETSTGEPVNYIITIDQCDVSGSFIGGFSASGAAIFLGGQYCGTEIHVANSSFSGILTGYNTSLLVANANNCVPGTGSYSGQYNIDINNIAIDGSIISYSDAGSLYFSNSKNTTSVEGSIENLSAYKTLQPANLLIINNSDYNKITANSRISISNPEAATGAKTFQFKLSLPTLYWYENDNSASASSETNSNTFTIAYQEDDPIPDIYVAKPITRKEAEILSTQYPAFNSLDEAAWADAYISAEGYPYIFTQVDDDWYLVIDYINNQDLMYSAHGKPSNLTGYKNLTAAIALALNENNEVIATSKQIED